MRTLFDETAGMPFRTRKARPEGERHGWRESIMVGAPTKSTDRRVRFLLEARPGDENIVRRNGRNAVSDAQGAPGGRAPWMARVNHGRGVIIVHPIRGL